MVKKIEADRQTEKMANQSKPTKDALLPQENLNLPHTTTQQGTKLPPFIATDFLCANLPMLLPPDNQADDSLLAHCHTVMWETDGQLAVAASMVKPRKVQCECGTVRQSSRHARAFLLHDRQGQQCKSVVCVNLNFALRLWRVGSFDTDPKTSQAGGGRILNDPHQLPLLELTLLAANCPRPCVAVSSYLQSTRNAKRTPLM